MVAAFKDIDWNCIHIWRVALGVPVGEAQLSAWTALLSTEERARANAFHREELREDYVVCHAALRSVLGQCVGILPQDIRFRSVLPQMHRGAAGGAATGKPALDLASAKASEARDLRFNLSHTRGAALIAVAQGREVGIDIEWQRPMEDMEGMARTVMSDEEYLQWLALPGKDQAIAFYRLWTRKESYLKAIGLGLFRDLHDITVPVSADFLNPSGDGIPVRDSAGAGVWRVADIPAESSHAASICCEGGPLPALSVQDWQVTEAPAQ